MSLPSDRQIDELVNGLTDFRPTKTAKVLKRAAQRQRRGGSARPDGYGRGRGEGPGGTPRLTVEQDDHGPEESVEFTSVELAFIARERAGRDELEDALSAALTHARAANAALQKLVAQVERLENLELDLEAKNERRCKAMARINVFEAFHKRREVNGTAWDLGRWAYDFVIAADRLPTLDECRAHHEGRHVRRAAEEKTA